MKKLAIVSVSYNGTEDTRELLESAKRLDLNGYMVKWLIVDNGSDRDPIPLSWETNYGVEIIQTGGNLGFAGGYNRGLKYAYRWGADLTLIINNDTLIDDNELIRKLSNEVIKNEKVGLVSPKILFAKGFEFRKDKYKKNDVGKVIWYAGGKFDWDNVTSVHIGLDEVDQGQYDKTTETEFVSGCCVMVSRKFLKEVGYLNEELFAYYEDSDWVERGRRQGWRQMYCGNTAIYHKVSQTAGVGSETTDYLLTRNRLWFGFRYARLRTKLALARQAVQFLVSGRPMQKWGVLDWLRNKYGGPRKSFSVEKLLKFPVELSVVILNYKTSKLLEKLLESLEKYRYESMEIVVLDNSPEDSSREVVKKYSGVEFIQAEKNLGFPAGNNAAIEYTRGKYVLLLNSDIEVLANSLTELVSAAQKLSDRAVVSGKLKFADGTGQDSCFYLPSVWGAIQEYFLGRQGKYFLYRPSGDLPVQVEGAVMACFLIPRNILNKAGLLWTKAFIYFEDIEYCRRLKRLHIPVYFVPGVEFVHHHGAASKEAGTNQANIWLVEASRMYHGRLGYWLVYWTLWWGQKFGSVVSPKPRWQNL